MRNARAIALRPHVARRALHDYPNDAGQGTEPLTINPSGAIAGFVVDSSNVNHGFVRAHDGTVTTFDPAGSLATVPFSINPSGAIAGFYIDSNAVSHGFVREPAGTIRIFDAPSAGAGARQCTVCIGNNPAGMLSGYYADASNVVHGFVATGKP